MTGKTPAPRRPGPKAAALRAPDASLPFSRPVSVGELPPQGLEIAIEANEAERAALARDYGLPSLSLLTATFRLAGRGRIVRVEGELQAELEQTCVVTLETFPVSVSEPVDVRFSEDAGPPEDEVVELSEQALDAPEPLVNGAVDLGALASEFLALALDPYPRKPGVAFDFEGGEAAEASPFAALAGLKAEAEAWSGVTVDRAKSLFATALGSSIVRHRRIRLDAAATSTRDARGFGSISRS